MNRRSFLKAGFLATTAGLVSHTLTGVTETILLDSTYSNADKGDDSPQNSPLTEENKLSQKEVSHLATELMSTYEISSAEKAQALAERMLSEARFSVVAGAVTGSLTTSGLDNIPNGFAHSRTGERTFWQETKIFGASAGTGALLQEATSRFSAGSEGSSLIKPDTLINEYGLSPEMAEKFSRKHQSLMTTSAARGAASMSLLQLMLVNPPEPETPASETPNPAGAA